MSIKYTHQLSFDLNIIFGFNFGEAFEQTILSKAVKKIKLNLILLPDGAFSIGIGLDRVGVVGPICRSCTMRYLQEKNRNKVTRRGSADRLSDA